jgi:phage terminase large subunit
MPTTHRTDKRVLLGMTKPTIQFPEKLQCLFQPKRYKVLYGGRGGAKSWGIARALLILGAAKPLRILCAREIQKSIKDSVHKLLSDQIDTLGLSGIYEIQQTIIRAKNGTEIFFEGLKHNVTNIKSYEAVDICWVEEAQMVSKSSWDVLIPTIRKAGSEIWVSFNPEIEDDETYQRFVAHPPTESIVVKIGWSDNPWFPEVLRQEKEDLQKRDPDAYLHVWEGHCRQMLDGAVYANELRQAQEEGRIMKVPYDAGKSVDTYWDLGWADNTSIWFVQAVGLECRVIDFYQNSLQPIQHYLKVLQGKPYIYGADNLPHDARAKQLGTGKSIEELMRASGRKVNIVPMLSVTDGINAARTLFSNCYFDADKCADGLHSLRHYRYETDPASGRFSKNPLHDWASHASDALRYMAVGFKKERLSRPAVSRPVSSSWMGM